MTKDEQIEPLLKANATSTQQQEKSSHIVLIDIKKAANDHFIHCVEKTLVEGDEDLKYVALSYRCGQVQETAVDTHLGYTAHVTSFDLVDFYNFCKMMTQETDLCTMDYVWVDAICMDPSQRKTALLYHVNHIYECANYIVAIPDLHLTYLKSINKTNIDIINNAAPYRNYIYHLLHGDMTTLEQLDQQWLDEMHTPKEPLLRYLLTRYTDYFAVGFMKCNHHHWGYDAQHSLGHIFATNPKSRTAPLRNLHLISIVKKVMGHMDETGAALKKLEEASEPTIDEFNKLDLGNLHICDKNDIAECPLEFFDDAKWSSDQLQEQHGDFEWKQAIPQRGASIRQSINFLVDLIHDWATRAWVISECHMAKQKKKNKMKYWFIQFYSKNDDPSPCSFFEFQFDTSSGGRGDFCNDFYEEECHFQVSNAVYQAFHVAMQQQLQQQRFLEMVLKSKASCQENRLYAILPISEYKDKLTCIMEKDTHTLVSVKLQLYEWMNIKHKWQLLILSSHANNMGRLLPTFATSNIIWPNPGDFPNLDDPLNCGGLDMDNTTAIVLTQRQRKDGSMHDDILQVKPKFYFRNQFAPQNFEPVDINPILRTLSQFHFPQEDRLDFIFIPIQCYTLDPKMVRPGVCPSLHHIVLVGHFAQNIWILGPHLFKYSEDAFRTWEFDNDNILFDVY